jgi:hypothetical protein
VKEPLQAEMMVYRQLIKDFLAFFKKDSETSTRTEYKSPHKFLNALDSLNVERICDYRVE